MVKLKTNQDWKTPLPQHADAAPFLCRRSRQDHARHRQIRNAALTEPAFPSGHREDQTIGGLMLHRGEPGSLAETTRSQAKGQSKFQGGEIRQANSPFTDYPHTTIDTISPLKTLRRLNASHRFHCVGNFPSFAFIPSSPGTPQQDAHSSYHRFHHR